MESPGSTLESLIRSLIQEEISKQLTYYQVNRTEPTSSVEGDVLKNVKETSAYIGVSQVTVHRWMKNKRIGYYQVGRRILFSLEKHIIPFLSRHEKRPKGYA